ncbi:hypothetical protein [Pontivivens ytuae]|uniref:Uncharacterized protein n=1 Tax=Pontivivens ytuae TaxID=2789856 RepID=A0A7S9LTM5_9RHOB|nr:hypothetical protein [Pontivivens ytuae]QPH54790.1 hypothetical protein I0K15_03175 [Pontivivens ytuae]
MLAHWLSRIPQDIDIHHADELAMLRAMSADRAQLEGMGFVAGTVQVAEDEMEIRFACGRGSVAINWVCEARLPEGGPVPDPIFGWRAPYAPVIERKIEMYLDSHAEKHAQDLREIVARSLNGRDLPVDLSARIAQLESIASPAETDG